MNEKFYAYAGRGGSIVMMLVPTALAKKIQEWGTQNVHDTDLCPTDWHNGREKSMHITVQNGILAENAEQIQSIVEGFGPVACRLGGVSIFQNPDKPYDVVKIDVQSEQLHEMNRVIADQIEINDPFPEYSPHITIAYVKKGAGNRLVGDKFFAEMDTELDDFICSGGGLSEIRSKLKKNKGKKQEKPLKETLDYGLVMAGKAQEALFLAQDVEDYLLEQGKTVADLTTEEKNAIVSQLKGAK